MYNLIIVESPTKAKTISKFLGSDFKIESSFGHVRDLPRGSFGVDVENSFEPKYLILPKAKKNISHLKELVKKSETVILATDEDREGEAISWHLTEALKLKNPRRIVFHEITKRAIEEALKNPRELDMKLVDAQQARRILDRIVGYKLSPFLWTKIKKGLSAGRVQSVAVRLIVDRENEIRNFKPEEYWTIAAELLKLKVGNEKFPPKADPPLAEKVIVANLVKTEVKNKEEADAIVEDLKKAEYIVEKIERKELRRNPPSPFTTSTLQQEAARRLGFTAKKTMFIAQQLYENGLITYMRTDSLNLSQDSINAAQSWLTKELGEKYSSPRQFKTKSKLAQEAHEAVRPTDPNLPARSANSDAGGPARHATPGVAGGQMDPNAPNGKLYDLIWRRFIASQMPQAVFDSTTIDIKAGKYLLRATGSILKFDGFLKIWPSKFEEKELLEVKKGEELKLKKINPQQHFTEPPPRYSEASLVKTLEEYGIGRPSTYAPTISVIQERDYVRKDQSRFYPTKMGELVNKVLTEHFPETVDTNFTANMENSLDAVAEGKEKWQDLVGAFWAPFMKNLETKYAEVGYQKIERAPVEKTDEVCEKCGQPMVIREGRYGKFMACSGFPKCRNTKNLNNADKKPAQPDEG